jgi:hypothetical protein
VKAPGNVIGAMVRQNVTGVVVWEFSIMNLARFVTGRGVVNHVQVLEHVRGVRVPGAKRAERLIFRIINSI